MAAADYLLCGVCDGKVIYDAALDYEQSTIGEIEGVCATCYSNGYRLQITRPEW